MKNFFIKFFALEGETFLASVFKIPLMYLRHFILGVLPVIFGVGLFGFAVIPMSVVDGIQESRWKNWQKYLGYLTLVPLSIIIYCIMVVGFITFPKYLISQIWVGVVIFIIAPYIGYNLYPMDEIA